MKYFNFLVVILIVHLSINSLKAQTTSLYDGPIQVFQDYKTLHYGLKDTLNNILLPATFQTLKSFSKEEQLYIIKEDGGIGIIHLNGDIIVEPKFKRLGATITKNRCVMQNFDDKWGVIDAQGNIIIPFEYQGLIHKIGNSDLYSFYVKENEVGRLGIINEKNEVLIKAKYENIRPNNNGMIVELNDKVGLISKTATPILPIEYESIEILNGAFAKIKKDKYFIFYDIVKRKKILDRSFASINHLVGDYFILSANNLVGLFDVSSNKFILPFEYHGISGQGYNKLTVNKHGKHGIYNLTSKEFTVPITYDAINRVDDGHFIVETNKQFGVIDSLNKMVVKMQDLKIEDFDNGVAKIGKWTNDNHSLLKENKLLFPENTTENKVLNHKLWIKDDQNKNWTHFSQYDNNGITYTEYGNYKLEIPNPEDIRMKFSKGKSYCIVKSDGKWGVYHEGRQVLDYRYDYLKLSEYMFLNDNIKSGQFTVAIDSSYGVVNDRSEIVIPLEYDEVRPREHGWVVYKDEKLGYFLFDEKNLTVPLKYEDAWVRNCRIIGKLGEFYGVVDYKDQIILPFQYDRIESLQVGFSELVLAYKNNKIEVYDTRYKKITDVIYDDVQAMGRDSLVLFSDGVSKEFTFREFISRQDK